MKNDLLKIITLSSIMILSGCQTPTGENFASNVYSTDQVNQQQESRTIEILAITSAKIKVANKQNQQTATLVGGLLGGVGGGVLGHNISKKYDKEGAVIGAVGGATLGATTANALVASDVLVDGVTISYVENNKTLSSTQVGRLCEYKIGTALVVTTKENETRVQPNASCPVPQET